MGTDALPPGICFTVPEAVRFEPAVEPAIDGLIGKGFSCRFTADGGTMGVVSVDIVGGGDSCEEVKLPSLRLGDNGILLYWVSESSLLKGCGPWIEKVGIARLSVGVTLVIMDGGAEGCEERAG